MKAVGYTKAGSIDAKGALVDLEIGRPVPGPRDLLVRVKAVSVNPVDVKVRDGMEPEGDSRILGFDASGIVEEIGSDVSLFAPGDEVFYAGDLTRPGTNAEFHAVDERIVGTKPRSLDFASAAALPLTSITAYEMLFDSFGINEGGGTGDALLVIGGAGGVGSIMIQLAKALTDLTVIATASRDDTMEWARRMGADHIINHRNSLDREISDLGIAPRYVAALTHTEQHFPAIVDLIQPRGHIGVIDDPEVLDIKAAKPKSLSVSWEFMFARSMFQTSDMFAQHELLNHVSKLVDDSALLSTVNKDGGLLTAANLIDAHRHQESANAIGKTVLTLL